MNVIVGPERRLSAEELMLSNYGAGEDIWESLEMQKSKMAVWGGLTNSCEKREAKRKGEKISIYDVYKRHTSKLGTHIDWKWRAAKRYFMQMETKRKQE